MGMPSWQVQKNLGVCLALWQLGGCLCLQKVGFLKVPFFTLKSGFLAILTPLLLYQNFPGYILFRCPEKIRALQIRQNKGLLILGRDILLEICSFIWYYVLQSFMCMITMILTGQIFLRYFYAQLISYWTCIAVRNCRGTLFTIF